MTAPGTATRRYDDLVDDLVPAPSALISAHGGGAHVEVVINLTVNVFGDDTDLTKTTALAEQITGQVEREVRRVMQEAVPVPEPEIQQVVDRARRKQWWMA